MAALSTGYSVPFTDVSLTAATAKTVVSVTASKVVTVCNVVITFDGVTASNTPVLVELVKGDGTTAGTSTAVTPLAIRGAVNIAAASTAAKNYTAEPTTLTMLENLRIPPTSGIIYQLPLGREIQGDSSTNKLIGLRLTAGSGVNVTGFLEFEE